MNIFKCAVVNQRKKILRSATINFSVLTAILFLVAILYIYSKDFSYFFFYKKASSRTGDNVCAFTNSQLNNVAICFKCSKFACYSYPCILSDNFSQIRAISCRNCAKSEWFLLCNYKLEKFYSYNMENIMIKSNFWIKTFLIRRKFYSGFFYFFFL
jgi:hypothetical protein